jgi:putative oxidoreductase
MISVSPFSASGAVQECRTLPEGGILQRLFSTFASSWPGFGLLLQRLVTGIALLNNGIAQLKTPAAGLMIPEISGAVLGLFIVAGLWTPVVGALIAAVEFWIVLAGGGDIWISVMLAVFGGTLAMIGPGAWSIDARLFGRKHIGG